MLGTSKYPDDYYPEGMLYGADLRSKYPRARVLSIDTSAAEALPGVEAVVTADDIPGENSHPDIYLFQALFLQHLNEKHGNKSPARISIIW